MDRLHNGRIILHKGDCLDLMRDIPGNSIDLIATDPPYFKVKNEQWDRQWDNPTAFITWLDTIAEQWQRILKPNGSLYCFASPKMARRVGNVLAERFNILCDIRWQKPPYSTKAEMFRKEDLRTYFPASETIFFCEHYGADNIAKGEAGYAAKCDELRGFVFEPLRAYLDSERQRAGVSVRQVAEAFQRKTGSRTVTGMAGHWFTQVQWSLPTEQNYQWLQSTLSSLNSGGAYLTREYESLRSEYESLRSEYESLRRPFAVTPDVPYTDVWTFPTVSTYKGKHPCEKPLAMMEHIITASTRPDAVVLDCFYGGNTTGVAAFNTGRRYIGIERDGHYYSVGLQRVQTAINALPPMAA